MKPDIRAARSTDVAPIRAFTTGTFEWGDYVPDMIEAWIDEPSGRVFVAVDANDVPIAVGRCVLLTDAEAWLHAARVHPDHRGKGIAGDMAVVMTDWARDSGAQVARLMIEEHNEPSIKHISKTAFRKKAVVYRCHRSLGSESPLPSTNGGTRRRSSIQARPVRSPDVEMVAAGWTTSDTGRAVRGLVAHSWTFHRLRLEDAAVAARESRLWDIGGSWAMSYEEDTEFDVEMVATSEPDARDVARSLADLAVSHGATTFTAWVADLPWIVEAFEHVGCQTEPSGIWEMSL
jgi:RimJ/RimL family protein N-acetyltransferase